MAEKKKSLSDATKSPSSKKPSSEKATSQKTSSKKTSSEKATSKKLSSKKPSFNKLTPQNPRKKTVGRHLGFGASEAYKLLRTNLVFSMADEKDCKIIGVTSALKGEGKSTTSINLSYTLAQNNKRVLLIEGDMRIPVIAATLKLDSPVGLSHVLAGINTLQEAVHTTELIQGLYVLPAGDIPPNPSELLSSKRMEQVLNELTTSFDFIIMDLPPVNAVSDSLATAHLLSGMIVVVRQDYCDRQSLAEAMRRMELLQVKVLGFVFNGVESPKAQGGKYSRGNRRGYGYGYGYGYSKKNT